MKIRMVTERKLNPKDFNDYCRYLESIGWSWKQMHELKTTNKTSKCDNDRGGFVYTTIERIG